MRKNHLFGSGTCCWSSAPCCHCNIVYNVLSPDEKTSVQATRHARFEIRHFLVVHPCNSASVFTDAMLHMLSKQHFLQEIWHHAVWCPLRNRSGWESDEMIVDQTVLCDWCMDNVFRSCPCCYVGDRVWNFIIFNSGCLDYVYLEILKTI